MVSKEEKRAEDVIKREINIRDRINRLSKPALKVALFSLRDIDEIERVIQTGEDYMKCIEVGDSSLSKKDRSGRKIK